jgi:hypothetical protein
MNRFYLQWMPVLLVIFTAAALAARTVGGRLTDHPALRGFSEGCDGKPQPCWYGIVPGVTDTAAIDAVLAAQGFTIRQGARGDEVAVTVGDVGCAVNIGLSKGNPRQTTWNRIYFTDCTGLAVGDMLPLMGEAGVAAWDNCGQKRFTLYYPTASISVVNSNEPLAPFDPTLPVIRFIVRPPYALTVPDDFVTPDYRQKRLWAALNIGYINARCG